MKLNKTAYTSIFFRVFKPSSCLSEFLGELSMNVRWINRQSLKCIRVVMHKTPGSLVSSSCSFNRNWGENKIPDVEFVVAKKDRFIHWLSGYCILKEKAKFVINTHIYIAINGTVPMTYNWKKKIPQGEDQIRRFNFPKSKNQISVSKVWIVSFQLRNTLCNDKSTRKIKWHCFARWFNHLPRVFWIFGQRGKKKARRLWVGVCRWLCCRSKKVQNILFFDQLPGILRKGKKFVLSYKEL